MSTANASQPTLKIDEWYQHIDQALWTYLGSRHVPDGKVIAITHPQSHLDPEIVQRASQGFLTLVVEERAEELIASGQSFGPGSYVVGVSHMRAVPIIKMPIPSWVKGSSAALVSKWALLGGARQMLAAFEEACQEELLKPEVRLPRPDWLIETVESVYLYGQGQTEARQDFLAFRSQCCAFLDSFENWEDRQARVIKEDEEARRIRARVSSSAGKPLRRRRRVGWCVPR